MQLPVQSGVTVANGAFATSYPVNLEHRIIETGLAQGQLVTTRGVDAFSTGPGIDRGGIAWDGVLHRVMGSTLGTVDEAGAFTAIGDVGTDNLPCAFAYSFDRLAVRSAEKLFYWDRTALAEVTDPDLGSVLDVDWIDGYFATTDGKAIVVTELFDPTQVQPLKYGSAESDPDAIVAVRNVREELVAVGRYTLQFFQNVGGSGFPFANVKGATIPFGAVSARAVCRVAGTLAFVGSARDEPLGLFILLNGTAQRISSREIDAMLAREVAETIEVESRRFGDEQQILIHLSGLSAVVNLRASSEAGDGTWHILHSGLFGAYRPRRAVWCYGKHVVGDRDSVALGTLTEAHANHFGAETHWRMDAGLIYSEGQAFILRDTELAGNFGRDPTTVFFSMTRDGEIWSNEVARRLTGQRGERCVWRPGVRVPEMAGVRFRGSGRVSISRCNVAGEPLTA